MIAPLSLAAALLLAAAAAFFLLLRRRFVLITVRGSSMAPTLLDGDRVLVLRRPAASLRRGQIVVLENPDSDRTPHPNSLDRDYLIKRVIALPGDPVPPGLPALSRTHDPTVPAHKLIVLGDNPLHSHDSRAIGYLATTLLLGIVLRPLRPTSRPRHVNASPSR